MLKLPLELYHKLYLKASRSGKSLNKWVVDNLKKIA